MTALVEFQHVTKQYKSGLKAEGVKALDDVSFTLEPGKIYGLLGPNGSGKSTLMKIICGMEQPDEGEVIIGQTIKIGYYAQEIRTDKEAGLAYMDPNMRVIDYIRNTAEYVQTVDGQVSASVMLERFLFPAEKQYSLLGKLSGGEKRRLNLLRVLMEAPNVLILDEPTNDLDIRTLTILEDYLDHFDGIVITVSHDRYFLDRTVRRIFAFENGTINQYEGGFTDYQARKQEEEGFAVAENSKSTGKTSSDNKSGDAGAKSLKNVKNRQDKLKFSYKEQKEYETIDADIAALEEKIEQLEQDLVANARDFVKLNEITKQKEEAEAALEEKMERWMYLQDLAERIEAQNS